jgi:hypothetical protein
VPHGVAAAILGELLEVRAFAALVVRLDADLGQTTIAGQPRIARDLREVGVHATRLLVAETLDQLPQTPLRAEAYIGRSEPHFAASRRRHGVRELVAAAAFECQRDWHAFGEQRGIDMIIEPALPALGAAQRDCQVHGPFDAERQRRWRPAHELRLGRSPIPTRHEVVEHGGDAQHADPGGTDDHAVRH